MTGVVASIDVPLDLILQIVAIVVIISIVTVIPIAASIYIPPPVFFANACNHCHIVGIKSLVSIISIDIPPRFDLIVANPVSAMAVLRQCYGATAPDPPTAVVHPPFLA